MKQFILTLQFLTRLPLPFHLNVEEDDFHKGIIYFPIVGLIVGGICTFSYWVFSFFYEGMFPVIIAVFMNFLITGAFHLDGLADTCDGVFSSRPREKMLEIMKDSRIGTNGTVAIVFDIIFRIVLLMGLSKENLVFGLLLAPVVSRTLQSILMYKAKYAREKSGLGTLYIGNIRTMRMILTILIGSILLFGFAELKGIIPLLLCILIGCLYRIFIGSRLKGMTGDTLGAAVEIIEIIFLVGLNL